MTEVISSVIDLRPLFEQVVFPLLGAVAVPVAAWATKKVADLAHIQLNEKQAHTVEVAMQNGISLALSRAQTAVDKHSAVPIKSELIADAVNYVLPKVPNALKGLGITPEGLAQRIEARLHDRVTGAS